MPEPIFELTSNSDEPTPVVETPTPSETPTPEVKKEETPVVPDSTEVPGTENPKTENLMELPDGRKVSPEEFQKQWKEHFYPEFTRKSQELARLKEGNPQKPGVNNPDEPATPEWKDPNYEPKTYAEIIEIATKEAEARIFQKQEAENKARLEVENRVAQDLAEIKKLDPNLDESKLFAHANKYGFTDLKSAHANYADVQAMILATEGKVLKNIQKREVPVAGSNNPKPVVNNEDIDRNSIGNFASASDYFSSLKGK